jgi:hypothetical protein
MIGIRQFRKPLCLAALLALAVAWAPERGAAVAQAGERSWIFQRSYHTHQDPSHVAVGPQSTPRIRYTQPFGEYVRGGWMYQNLGRSLRSSSPSYTFYEFWYQYGQRF